MALSVEDDRPKSDDRKFRNVGLAIIVLVFGVLGAWAAFAPLESAALSPGVITVESYRKTVQHLEGGIVKSIAVHDGDLVSRNQTLLTLDDTQVRAQLEVLRGQYYIAAAQDARLRAQRDNQAQVVYPPELINRQKDDTRIHGAIQTQNQTFMARKTALDNETALYQRQVEQLRAKAAGLKSQRQSREHLVESYRGELQDFSDLLKEGFTEKQKVRELERNLSQSEGQLGELQADIAATELQVGETQLKIVQLHKDLQREVAKELSDVESELFELREKIQSLEATFKRTTVLAPESGMVMGLTIHTLGAVIPPGGRLLDIVPQNEKLIVEARVSPMDIDRVKVGQTAEVRFSAFKSRDTPKVEGKLISLSADRMQEDNRPDAQPYYLARVEVSSDGIRDLAQNHLELIPGMPAEVLINTGARTFLDYLTRPLTDTFARSFIED